MDTYSSLNARHSGQASRVSALSSFKRIPPEIKQQAVRTAVKSQFVISSKDHRKKNRLLIQLVFISTPQGLSAS